MTHVREPNSQAAIKSMDGVRHDIDNSNLPQFTGENLPEYMCFSYSRAYLSYETDKVNLIFSQVLSKRISFVIVPLQAIYKRIQFLLFVIYIYG